jgi:3-carboxy-cis,cis-muconate cycloisomerase
MTASLFEQTLTTAEMAAVFDDTSLVADMLRFEAALAQAQAAVGIVPPTAAQSIVAACQGLDVAVPALVSDARQAGSFAIPLVTALRGRVAQSDASAAAFVHHGSTSQDVIDTAMALATRRALALIDHDLHALVAHLLRLGEQHAATPLMGRTLMQSAQVITFGLKITTWAAPLMRCRAALQELSPLACALQLGGAVGTLAALGEHGPAVARHLAQALGLPVPAAPWHTQRDPWMRLAAEVGVLCGALGKVGTDVALMGQAEVGELAEPHERGRGSSSAMPHKRNPVGAMTARAAARRAPHRVAALLAAMPQEHERGLGAWQAELAEWPGLFMAAHGALHALVEVMSGLHVDAPRMRENIERWRAQIGMTPADVDREVRHAQRLARERLTEMRGRLEP